MARREGSTDAEMIEAINAALEFDYLRDRHSGDDTAAGIVKSRLAAIFLSEILVEREIARRLAADMSAGRRVVLTGANGCGKTATLISVNRLLKTAAAEGHPRVDMIVFNGNPNELKLRNRATVDDKSQFILDKLTAAVFKRIHLDEDQLDEDFQVYLTKSSDAFESFRLRYQKGRKLNEVLSSDQAIADKWFDAYEQWRAKPSPDRLRLVLRHLRLKGWSYAIAIDNCDFLDDMDLEAAADAARAFSAAAEVEVGVVVAARPATAERVRQRMNIGNVKSRYVNSLEKRYAFAAPGPNSSDWVPSSERVALDLFNTYEIFARRLSIFDDPIVQKKLTNLRRRAKGRVVRDPQLAAFRNVALRVLTDYFDFDGRDIGDDEFRPPAQGLTLEGLLASVEQQSDDTRADLTRVFAMWHNGSVRELAVSLMGYVLRTLGPEIFTVNATIDGLETADAPLVGDVVYRRRGGANPRTLLFRHLLFHETTPDGEGFPILHNSCRLFEATPGTEPADFAFPSARVLQMLDHANRKGRYETVREISAALKEFGVADERSVSTIAALASRTGYGSGLVRVDGLRFGRNGQPDESTIVENASVEIMPAGSILISRVVFVIEYEFWSTIADRDARATVADKLGVKEATMVTSDFVSRSANRISVALSFLSDVLVERFSGDHNYIRPLHVPSKSESDRLRLFARRFGFGEQDWHVTRAIRQIERFVASGREPQTLDERYEQTCTELARRVDDDAVRRYQYLVSVSNQLDLVYRSNLH